MRHHDGAIPVDGDKGPSQWHGYNRGVDESRVGVVAEVEEAQVGKVEQKNELSPGEVGADKEHDEGEVEKVVEDEVAADAGGGVHVVGVLGEEVTDVSKLEDEENDPANELVSQQQADRHEMHKPVDIGQGGVHGECAGVQVVLVPDAFADGEAIVRLVNGVVNGDDDRKHPSEDGEDLVDDDGLGRVSLSPAERVDYERRGSVRIAIHMTDRCNAKQGKCGNHSHVFQSVAIVTVMKKMNSRVTTIVCWLGL
jgi:hypothetical protein